MLIASRELSDPQHKLNAMLRGWDAVDPDSGAVLQASHGRSRNAPRYVLTLPNRTVEQRGGLFTDFEVDYPQGRKFVRAWTLQEAIDAANKKLAKMLPQPPPSVPVKEIAAVVWNEADLSDWNKVAAWVAQYR